MGWFTKKHSPPGSLKLDLDSHWKNGDGIQNGYPMYVRLNRGLQSVVGHPDYGHEVLVSIAFNACRDNGLPATEEELDAVDAIEDLFKRSFEQNQESLLAVVVTTQGRRDLTFYTSNPQGAIGRFEQELTPLMRTHCVEMDIQPDRDWTTYRLFSENG